MQDRVVEKAGKKKEKKKKNGGRVPMKSDASFSLYSWNRVRWEGKKKKEKRGKWPSPCFCLSKGGKGRVERRGGKKEKKKEKKESGKDRRAKPFAP